METFFITITKPIEKRPTAARLDPLGQSQVDVGRSILRKKNTHSMKQSVASIPLKLVGRFIEDFITKHHKEPLHFHEFRHMLCATLPTIRLPFPVGSALCQNLSRPRQQRRASAHRALSRLYEIAPHSFCGESSASGERRICAVQASFGRSWR